MIRLLKYPELCFAVLPLLLLGCAGPITMNKIQHIERGIHSDSLSSMVERKPARVFTVVDPENGLEYQVQIYPMQTGTETHYVPGYYIGDVYYFGGYETYSVNEDFAFLFFEDSLVFWGFLHEFARSDDPLVRRLAPLIIEMSGKGR